MLFLFVLILLIPARDTHDQLHAEADKGHCGDHRGDMREVPDYGGLSEDSAQDLHGQIDEIGPAAP